MKALPALLTNAKDEFIAQFHTLKPHFRTFQIDICDGKLVPNTTLSISEISEIFDGLNAAEIKPYVFDFDLMVTDIKPAVQALESLANKITINNVFLHSASSIPTKFPVSDSFTTGIAIDPPDSIADIDQRYGLNSIQAVQIMTVNPGFQGSPFLKEMLKKIDQLRLYGYKLPIYIDGGVNASSIPTIVSNNYKPDFCGIGSFLTKAQNLTANLEFLSKHNIQPA